MKKTALLSVIAVFGISNAFAQTTHFSVGAGYGLTTRSATRDIDFKETGAPVISLTLSRQWKRIEAGIILQGRQLISRQDAFRTTYNNPMGGDPAWIYHEYGRVAVAGTVFSNYIIPVGKSSFYAGLHAGVLATSGGKTKLTPYHPIDDNEFPETRYGYSPAAGFTGGLQAGYRYQIGKKLEMGAELYAGGAWMNLKSRENFSTLNGSAAFLLYSGTINLRYSL